MSNNIEKVKDALNGKLVSVDCQKCGNEQQISTQPAMITTGSQGNIQGSVDCSTLVCSKCGHVDLFVDQILGV